QEAQQGRALTFFGLGRQRRRHLVANDRPVATLGRGLRRQTVENEAFRRRERLVPQEVIEAFAQPGREDLERTNGWSDQPRLDLADEALCELLTRALCLAHATLPTRVAALGPPAPRRVR